MRLFSNKQGGLMDVIRCDEEHYLVWKWRPSGQEVNSTAKENAIRYGSSLRVKEGEMAVFVYKQDDGQMMDYIKGPYDGTIKSDNFPVLARIVGAAFGGASPFQAEIYFFNLEGNNQIKFAVPYFDVADPRFKDITVPVSVRGIITFTLTDVDQFIRLNRLVNFSLDEFNDQISGVVAKFAKDFVTNCPIEQDISVSQIERKIVDISNKMEVQLASELVTDFGIHLKRLDLSAIEIDKESESYEAFVRATKEQQVIIAEQAGRRAEIETEIAAEKGHLGAESQYIQAHAINKQAEVLGAAAENLGEMGSIQAENGGMSTAGMIMGMGMAAGMGQQMAGMMHNSMNTIGQTMQNGAMTPPPIPGAANYMIALNGQAHGPFGMQQMQQMAQSGQINAQTLVWCQGMAAWESAINRPDLANLFAPPTPNK